MFDVRVLNPRPETEWVTDSARGAVADLDELIAVDLGNGSGAIALALAAERWPGIEVWATDVSPDAIAVARANLAGLGRRASCVRLLEGSWFDPLPEELRGRVDLVVSNPPYVAERDPLPEEVAGWEPTQAPHAGPDGLSDIRRVRPEEH